jgi:hypothetical protein
MRSTEEGDLQMTELAENEAVQQEDLWGREMLQIYEDALAIGYEASGLRQLMASHGPITAAKILINMNGGSDGYAELWKLGRLDLSVEARALKPDFRALFSDAELARCRRRLLESQWTRRPPWNPTAL